MAAVLECVDAAVTAHTLAERAELVTAPEVARRLRVSRMAIQAWVARGSNPLPCIETPSGVRVFVWAEVYQWDQDRKRNDGWNRTDTRKD